MRFVLLICTLLAACAQPGPPVRTAPAPAPPPAQRAPATQAEAARIWEATLGCPNHAQVMGALPYPGQAVAANIVYGRVEIEFALTPRGQPTRIQVLSASSPIFVEPAVKAVQSLQCKPVGNQSTLRTLVEFNNGVN